MKSAQPKINGLLGEAMTDPAMAEMLLKLSAQPSKAGKLAKKVERLLPVPGLALLENGQ